VKKIAFIDFDGTIYNGDSMLDFAKILRGDALVKKALLKSSLNIVLKKLGLRSSQKAKEQFLGYVFSQQSQQTIQKAVHQFTETVDGLLFEKAQNELEFLKKENTKIVIVSASCQLWLKPWCDREGFDLISSKLEKTQHGFSGKLVGKNCKGQEKVVRIRQLFSLENYSRIYCYGNDSSDLPMIDLATEKTKSLYL
jgi:HAD superfamily hydrolase (TIGR01490 family)